MTDYTPTTEDVRGAVVEYLAGWVTQEAAEADFDRWLAQHEAKVKADVLRETADRPIPDGVMNVKAWLRDHAARIDA